jgi:mannose-1-phosphate guanylyltransferase/phosphomannomutase
MVPDQYSANVHVYVESMSEAEGKKLQDEYIDKIQLWLEEQS